MSNAYLGAFEFRYIESNLCHILYKVASWRPQDDFISTILHYMILTFKGRDLIVETIFTFKASLIDLAQNISNWLPYYY
jgi:hypothetical protein